LLNAQLYTFKKRGRQDYTLPPLVITTDKHRPLLANCIRTVYDSQSSHTIRYDTEIALKNCQSLDYCETLYSVHANSTSFYSVPQTPSWIMEKGKGREGTGRERREQGREGRKDGSLNSRCEMQRTLVSSAVAKLPRMVVVDQ